MGRLRRNLARLLGDPTSAAGRKVDLCIQVLIVVAIVTFSVETLPDLPVAGRKALEVIEIVIVTVFQLSIWPVFGLLNNVSGLFLASMVLSICLRFFHTTLLSDSMLDPCGHFDSCDSFVCSSSSATRRLWIGLPGRLPLRKRS